jgi:predicted ester cyclase
MDNLKEIVRPFYTQCLTVNGEANVAEIMGKLLADSFQSVNSAETKGKAQLTGQVQGFWKMIPNLKWEPQEILQDGNRVIVRSVASGNPQGNFMGIECDGSKAFSIMTIDIHTVENGQIMQVFHVEEWATGMKQLKS